MADAVITALEKLPADRFSSAKEFASALSSESRTTSRRAAPMSRSAPSRRGQLAALAIGLAAGLLLGAAWMRQSTASARESIVLHRTIFDPDDEDTRANFTKLTVSPDGRLVVASDPNDARSRLSLRRVDELTGTEISGTDVAVSPFVSWDSRLLGFVKSGTIYTVPVEGGVPSAVPKARTNGVGAPAFTPDGRIVYTDIHGGLMVIRGDGTERRTLTSPDSGRVDVSPNVLPNGKGVLFTISGTATGFTRSGSSAVIPLAGGASHLVSEDASTPQYDDGHVIVVRGDGALMVIPFDQSTLQAIGAAQLLGDHVAQALGGIAHLSVGHGVIIYQKASNAVLTLMDRNGVGKPMIQRAAVYHRPSVSPDGRTVAVDIEGDRDGQRDVWTLDIPSGTLSRLTNVGDGHDANWSPDGGRITFITNERSDGDLFTVPTDRSSAPAPFRFPAGFDVVDFGTPGNWLPDGRSYIGGTNDPVTLGDIWLLHADGSAGVPLAHSPADEHSPTASPDGHWFAYVSNESGHEEVYVQAMSPSGARVQISRDGGSSPVWSRTGHALYYLEPAGNRSNLMEVKLGLSASPVVLSRQQLVNVATVSRAINHANFDVMPDDQHFVVIVPEPGQGIIEVTGWTAALVKR